MVKKVKFWSIVAAAAVLVPLMAACKAPVATPKPTPAPTQSATAPPSATSAPTRSATAAPAATTPAPAADPWQKTIEAAQKEGKVTLYVSAFSPPAMQALTKGFKSNYGITVEWVQGTGPSNLEKIKNEQAAKAYTADLYFFGTSIGWAAKEAKVLVPIPGLPVANEQGVWRTNPYSFDPNEKIFIVGMDESPPGGQAPFINTKLVPPDKEPKSWQDLLAPQWKGKIMMTDPSVAGPGSDGFTFLRRAGVLTTEYFQKLAQQNPTFTRDYRGHLDAVGRGDYSFGWGGAFGIFAPPLVDAGTPLKPLFFKEGLIVTSMVWTQVANAPHPNAARLFVNWTLTKEGQTIWQQNAQGVSQRTDVPNFAPQYLRIPDGVKRIPYDWDGLTQENQEIKNGVAAKIFGIK